MPDREPPRFFLDRGLNAESIAAALRGAGLDCQTMDDRYGQEAGKHIEDPQWITEATEDGLILLHKDKKIRRRPIEKAALIESEARSFAMANGNITGAEIVARFINNLPRMLNVIERRGGPYFYHVHAHKITKMSLR